MMMSDHPDYIDNNQFCSPARRLALQVHANYYWCCQQVARPVIAVLNFFDETPRFSRYLRQRQEEEKRVATPLSKFGGRMWT